MNLFTRAIRVWYNRHFRKVSLEEIEVEELSYKKDGDEHMMKIMVSHPEITAFASSFALMFQEMQEHGLPSNFLEMQLLDPATLEKFSVRIERSTRPGPAEQISNLKHKIVNFRVATFALMAYREWNSTNFQLEKLDDFIHMLQKALEESEEAVIDE